MTKENELNQLLINFLNEVIENEKDKIKDIIEVGAFNSYGHGFSDGMISLAKSILNGEYKEF